MKKRLLITVLLAVALGLILVIFLLFRSNVSFSNLKLGRFEKKRSEHTSMATQYCGKGSVYICDDEIVKVESDLLGGGTTYYKSDGTEIRCPVVAPDYISDDCKQLQSTNLHCGENICLIH